MRFPLVKLFMNLAIAMVTASLAQMTLLYAPLEKIKGSGDFRIMHLYKRNAIIDRKYRLWKKFQMRKDKVLNQ